MAYELRDANGNLKATFSNRIAGIIINGVSGNWAQKSFVNSGKTNVFVLTSNHEFGDLDTVQIKIFLWSGDYLKEHR